MGFILMAFLAKWKTQGADNFKMSSSPSPSPPPPLSLPSVVIPAPVSAAPVVNRCFVEIINGTSKKTIKATFPENGSLMGLKRWFKAKTKRAADFRFGVKPTNSWTDVSDERFRTISDELQSLRTIYDCSSPCPPGLLRQGCTSRLIFKILPAPTRRKQSAEKQLVVAKQHVKVGDVFVWTWGWNCTNVEFCRITRMTASSVYYSKLKARYDGSPGYGGKCVPIIPDDAAAAGDEEDVSEVGPKRLLLDNNNVVQFRSGGKNGNFASYARKWDGEPQTWTPFMD